MTLKLNPILLFGLLLGLVLLSLSACKDDPYADSLIAGTWELQTRTYDNGFGNGPQVTYSIDSVMSAEDIYFYYIFEPGGRFVLGVPDSLVRIYGTRSRRFGDFDYNADAGTLTFPADAGFPPEMRTWQVAQLDERALVLELIAETDDVTTPAPDDKVLQITQERWQRLE